VSRSDLEALAEHTARELLSMSADEAFAMLDRGALSGEAVEGTLRGLRRLLAAVA
jgi:hypothetical protein